MELIKTFLIAIALSLDSFTVAITGGSALKKVRVKDALLVAAYFGFFQFLMTYLGWLGGSTLSGLINSFDHWIALILLLFIGIKMILESFKKDEDKNFSMTHKVLFILAVATSIDAFGVGLSIAFLDKPILFSSIIIGLTTATFSFNGVYLGKILKKILDNKAEIIGGLLLIGIGLNIAFEHGAFNFLIQIK